MVVKNERCTVQLLDDTQTIQVEFKRTDVGQVVLDKVCDHLNLAERDYFGLRYVDQNRHRYWLDPSKPILKQVKNSQSIVFAFRVKFYPADPSILKEDLTRYLLVLQLRRDLLHGRLYCPQNEGAILGGHIVQAELGDFNPNEHVGNYVSQFKILLNQTPKLEEKIAQVHKTLKGQTPEQGDINFLKKACTLDTYGYYPYTIKDSKAGQVYMGATPHGILVYQTHRKLHHLKWSDVEKMDWTGKDFIIYPKIGYFDDNNLEHDDFLASFDASTTNGSAALNTTANSQTMNRSTTSVAGSQKTSTMNTKNKDSKKKPVLRFICPSSTFSKHLWKYMLAEQAFFTSMKSTDVKPVVKRSLLFRNSTFRYSGRVLEELKHVDGPKRQAPSFERLHMQRQANRDERGGPWANKFATMPSRTNKPEVDEHKTHEAPEFGGTMPMNSQNHTTRPALRESLLLDTTNQSSPVITPMEGLSPRGDNVNSLIHTDETSHIIEHKEAAPVKTSSTPTDPNYSSITKVTTQQVNGSTTMKEWSATVWSSGTVQKEDEKIQRATYTPSQHQPNAGVTTRPPIVGEVHGAKEPSKTGGAAIPQLNLYQQEKSATDANATTTPRWKSALKLVLASLVFALFAFAVLIAVMEVKDENFRRYIDSTPAVDAFRHRYYDPSRHYVVEMWAGRR